MSTKDTITCPECGAHIERFRQPALTVDIIIESQDHEGKIVLIERKNPPPGWAIPGGFVDYGETVEAAAVREAEEETSLKVELKALLGVYSDPERDPRGHTVSVVFVTEGRGTPQARDDAAELDFFDKSTLPETLAFDHARILSDYFEYKEAFDLRD